jgi:hypothetical protein
MKNPCPFVASHKNVSHLLPPGDREYPCVCARSHRDDHLVEIAPGKPLLAIPQLAQGRPPSPDPLSEKIMVRMSEEDVERLDELRGDRSRSAAVRNWVREAMKESG